MPILEDISSSSFEPGTIVARADPDEREPRAASAQRIPGATMLAAVETVIPLAYDRRSS